MILLQEARIAPKACYDKGFRDAIADTINWDLRLTNRDYRDGCAAAEQEHPQQWQIEQHNFYYHSEGVE